jgi:CDP-6-deoxy-D-xylo-4-hexulose-3-dehydrase
LPGYNLRPLELEGAIGVEQIRRIPALIEARRRNGRLLQQAMVSHPDLMIQRELGESSWFGFSLVIRPGSRLTRATLRAELDRLGFECRPIVAGNFTKNEVIRFFDHSIHGALPNAEHVDTHGLFVGNHHYDIPEAIEALAGIRAA